MASPTTGQFILERLADAWGVRRIYGYSGDGIGGRISFITR
jgi:pyruvate dehydrogenase (quinone)